MIREDKKKIIDSLTERLNEVPNFYLADISDLNAVKTSKLRRLCFNKKIKLVVTKNTLLRKALENSEYPVEELTDALKGPTSVMFSESGSTPAKIIKEFRKKEKSEKPLLKAAYVEETVYLGEKNLELLTTIKSKNELIADVVLLLQSPMRNVISAVQSGGNGITGVLKAIKEKKEEAGE